MAQGYVLGPVVISGGMGAGISERSGPATMPGRAPEWLPKGHAVCESLHLNVETPGSCTLVRILDASATQTDPALWFDKISSNDGGPPTGCDNATAIQVYTTVLHTNGTVYLCRATKADDHITDEALAALRSRAAQLNGAKTMTFADHEVATRIKALIRSYTRPEASSK